MLFTREGGLTEPIHPNFMRVSHRGTLCLVCTKILDFPVGKQVFNTNPTVFTNISGTVNHPYQLPDGKSKLLDTSQGPLQADLSKDNRSMIAVNSSVDLLQNI